MGMVVRVRGGGCNCCSYGDGGDCYGGRKCGGGYGYGCSEGCFLVMDVTAVVVVVVVIMAVAVVKEL